VIALLAVVSRRTHTAGVNTAIRLSDSIGLLAVRDAGIRNALETLGLDYYCAGNLSLDDAARGAGLDPLALCASLEHAERSPNGWEDRGLRDVITHLEHEHHQLLRSIMFHSAMLFDAALAAKTSDCIAAMRRTFRELSSQLIVHIEKEEHLFFPLLLSLEEAWLEGRRAPVRRSDMRSMVSGFVRDHASIAAKLAQLHEQAAPVEGMSDDVCKRLRANLAELRHHLHQDLNLENYVVFPRAIALEDGVHGSPPPLTAVKSKGGTP